MSLADYLINFIIFVIQHTLLSIFPTEFAGLTLSSFETSLSGIGTTLSNTINFLNTFIPLQLFFSLISIMLIAEIALHFGWKSLKWVINVIRGSGG